MNRSGLNEGGHGRGFAAQDAALTKAQWQSVLFSEQPLRADLLKLSATWPRQRVTLRIHRNHSFEHVASAMEAYASFGSWYANILYSSYDDSLNFSVSEAADIELVWLDLERYGAQLNTDHLKEWVHERLTHLRTLTPAPILFLPLGGEAGSTEAFAVRARDVAGLRICDISAIAAQLGARLLDDRAARLSGSRLSNAANILIAREMACRWIPAAIWSPIKAVVVDLDNTLHQGVLGEDGPAGVVLTEGHLALQQRLREMRQAGVFLALLSRNEIADVRELLETREDFPLKWDDFSTHAISWEDKAIALKRIADTLRIGVDALLFIDDNPGELAAVTRHLPGIKTIFADRDARQTLQALNFYPGLWQWSGTRDDTLRVNDLKAEQARKELAADTSCFEDYLDNLQVALEYSINRSEQLPRLYDLCRKTNQFNTALRRFSEAELAAHMASPDSRVVSIRLTDRLSDSGTIAVIVGHARDQKLTIEEICISCRALGRKLEGFMISHAIRLMLTELQQGTVEIMYRVAPRNQPALEWLAEFAGTVLSGDHGAITLPSHVIAKMPIQRGIKIQVRDSQ